MKSSTAYKPQYDTVIVGGRCAGAATAMLLARAGASVLLVDRQTYSSDTVSTHALMRGGVLQLQRWGVLQDLLAAGTPPVMRSTFHYGAQSIPIAIKPEHGVAHLCAPRRTVLDRVLVDAAVEAGVDVRHETSLDDLQVDRNGRVVGIRLKDAEAGSVNVRTNLVVGADGRQSTVARLVQAPTYVQGFGASGYVYGYFEGLQDDGYHWYFEHKVAAGVIPTNHGQHCVFVAVPRTAFPSTFRGDLMGAFLKVAGSNSPALREALENARIACRLRGFAVGPGFFRQSYGPGWALVGDAGYFKDPLTAHGITDALRDAELLANAVCNGGAGALARYQEERDVLSRPLLNVTDAIASFEWSLDEVKEHHARLSKAMKVEVEHISRMGTAAPLAA